MVLQKNAMLLLSLVAVFALMASASTVTLTSSCSNIAVGNSGKYVNFTISNSGDGTATSMILTAAQQGLYSNTVNNVTSLPPGSAETFRFYLTNVTYPGSYGFGVYALYMQGQQSFIVSFPCVVSFMNSSGSQLAITNASVANRQITAQVMNLARHSINATTYFIASPITGLSTNPTAFSIAAGDLHPIKAEVAVSKLNITVPVAILVTYVENNMSYTSMSTVNVSLTSSNGFDLTTMVLVAIIAVVVALIIASIAATIRKRGAKAGMVR